MDNQNITEKRVSHKENEMQGAMGNKRKVQTGFRGYLQKNILWKWNLS